MTTISQKTVLTRAAYAVFSVVCLLGIWALMPSALVLEKARLLRELVSAHESAEHVLDRYIKKPGLIKGGGSDGATALKSLIREGLVLQFPFIEESGQPAETEVVCVNPDRIKDAEARSGRWYTHLPPASWVLLLAALLPWLYVGFRAAEQWKDDEEGESGVSSVDD